MLLDVTGARLAALLLRLGEKPAAMLGYSEPCSAKTFSQAWRSAACAAGKVGLAAIACSTSAFRAGERNKVHHCPGMSRPCTKCCVSPPATGAEAVCAEIGSEL